MINLGIDHCRGGRPPLLVSDYYEAQTETVAVLHKWNQSRSLAVTLANRWLKE